MGIQFSVLSPRNMTILQNSLTRKKTSFESAMAVSNAGNHMSPQVTLWRIALMNSHYLKPIRC